MEAAWPVCTTSWKSAADNTDSSSSSIRLFGTAISTMKEAWPVCTTSWKSAADNRQTVVAAAAAAYGCLAQPSAGDIDNRRRGLPAPPAASRLQTAAAQQQQQQQQQQKKKVVV
jgi:hypothetical protein